MQKDFCVYDVDVSIYLRPCDWARSRLVFVTRQQFFTGLGMSWRRPTIFILVVDPTVRSASAEAAFANTCWANRVVALKTRTH